MKVVRFGGPLGAMPQSGIIVHPTFHGEASLPDDASEQIVQLAPACFMKHMKAALTDWYPKQRSPGSVMADVSPAVIAAVSSELGVQVQIGSLAVTLSDEDRAQLKARAAEAQQPKRDGIAAMGAPAPGVGPQAAGPAPYGGPPPGATAPAAVAAPKKKSGALFAIVGGAVLLLGVVVGLVWHFTHEHAAAPAAAHEHAHGKH
jgi:hypothetical protein